MKYFVMDSDKNQCSIILTDKPLYRPIKGANTSYYIICIKDYYNDGHKYNCGDIYEIIDFRRIRARNHRIIDMVEIYLPDNLIVLELAEPNDEFVYAYAKDNVAIDRIKKCALHLMSKKEER